MNLTLDVMQSNINDALCDPSGVTPEERDTNEREWSDPANWHGWIELNVEASKAYDLAFD